MSASGQYTCMIRSYTPYSNPAMAAAMPRDRNQPAPWHFM